jgi:hypothetical protein
MDHVCNISIFLMNSRKTTKRLKCVFCRLFLSKPTYSSIYHLDYRNILFPDLDIKINDVTFIDSFFDVVHYIYTYQCYRNIDMMWLCALYRMEMQNHAWYIYIYIYRTAENAIVKPFILGQWEYFDLANDEQLY